MKRTSTTENYGNTWETEVSDSGEFVRHKTGFRSQIRSDGSTDFPPASGRYHLYVSSSPFSLRAIKVRCAHGHA